MFDVRIRPLASRPSQALLALLALGIPGATAASFDVNAAEGRLYVALDETDAATRVGLTNPYDGHAIALESVSQRPDVRLLRSPVLPPGPYQLELGERTQLVSILDQPTRQDVEAVAAQLAAITAALGRLNASLELVKRDVARLVAENAATRANLTALDARLGTLQASLGATKQAVDQIHVPPHLVQQRDLDLHATEVKSVVRQEARREPWSAYVELGALAVLIGGLVTLLVLHARRPSMGDKPSATPQEPLGDARWADEFRQVFAPQGGAKTGWGEPEPRPADPDTEHEEPLGLVDPGPGADPPGPAALLPPEAAAAEASQGPLPSVSTRAPVGAGPQLLLEPSPPSLSPSREAGQVAHDP